MTTISPTVFLGGGRITSALVAGLRLAGDRRPIVVYDRNREKMRRLRQESGVEIARDLLSAIVRAGMLIVAVRPASVAELLHQIAGCEIIPRLCVSLAAGVPLSNLRVNLPAVQWVRAMPSPACRMARGLTALCFSRGTAKKERSLVRDLFIRIGQLVELPESQFDAFTVTYSSSHGYHALATLAAAAHQAGLDRKTALTAAAHALADGIAYWRESGSTLDELLHEAATPGGIAAATMRTMEQAGYRRVVAKGIAAGIRQAQRNAKAPHK